MSEPKPEDVKQRERVRAAKRRGLELKARGVLPADPSKFWETLRKESVEGCWLYPRVHPGNGYGDHRFWVEGASVTYRAHRLAWMLARGPIAPGMVVMHRCDRRACCNPAHLELGTVTDNNRDCVRKGRAARGATQGNSKLSNTAVMEIRRRVAAGETTAAVAARFRINKTTVSRIARGRQWTHLPVVPVPPRTPKPNCVRGHPFNAENSHWDGRRRVCDECRRIRQRKRPLLKPKEGA